MVRDEFGTRKEDRGNLSAQGKMRDPEDVLGGADTHQDLYLNSLDPDVSQQQQHCFQAWQGLYLQSSIATPTLLFLWPVHLRMVPRLLPGGRFCGDND